MGLLLVTEGKVEVTDVGIGVFAGSHVDLEDDTVARRKATGRWVGGTGCVPDLPRSLCAGRYADG